MKSLHKLFLICLSLAILGVSSFNAQASILSTEYGYAVNSDNDDILYAINLTNGSTIAIGTGTGFASVEGLTWDPLSQYFYGANDGLNQLVKINLAGEGFLVGDMGVDVDAPGLTISDNGVIYMTQEKDDSPLYSVDKTTGVATFIGDTDVEDITGLAFLNGTLYGVSDEENALYTINTVDATATKVGTGLGYNIFSEVGAAAINGSIWAVEDTGRLHRIDPVTGLGTYVTDTIDGFDDLSAGPPVIPEPSSLAIFSMTAFGMVFLAMRRRRRENHSA